MPLPPPLLRLRDRPLAGMALLCTGYALLLVWFGITSHPIEVLGGESDHYVHKAERLLEGTLPHDPFRPMLYPLLVAAAALPIGDCFAAGRIVSALSAALLVLFAFGFVRSWLGTGPAVLTALLLMANGGLAVHGVQVATDTAFAAFCAATLWACARAGVDPRARAAVWTGVVFALAWFTRYAAVTLLVPVAIALLQPRQLAMRSRLARLGAFAATAAACLIPHFVLTWAVFGDPLHDENWRSFALKVHGDWDTRTLETSTFEGLWSVLAHDPGRILALGWQDLVSFGKGGVRELLQGGLPAGWIGGVCTALCAVGAVRSARERRGGGPLGFGLAYLLLVCVTFAPFDRLTLPLLPVLYGATAGGVLWPALRPGLASRPVAWIAAGALVAAVASGLPARLSQFAAQHPVAEVAAARRLVGSRAEPFRMLSSYPNMSRHVPCPADWIPVRMKGAGSEPETYLQRLREKLEETGARCVVLGRCTLGPALFDGLRLEAPPFLRRIEGDEEVLVFEAVGLAPEWIAAFSVAPERFAGGSLQLEVVLREGEHADSIAHVVAAVWLGEGTAASLETVSLRRESRLVYRARLENPALAPGRYRLTPAAFDRAGRMSQGEGVVLEVVR